jgi:hypothetical protein
MKTEAIFAIAAKVTGASAIKDLERSIKNASNSGDRLKRSFAGGALALKALIAAIPVAGFTAIVRSSINLADNLNDVSERTGVAVEQLQKYKAAADLSGTSIDEVASSINKLNKTIVESRDGAGGAAKAFKALQIDLEGPNGLKTADQIISEMADRFARFPDGPQKAALAMAVFGKAGANMVPFLNQGSEAIERFNLGIDKEFAQRAALFNDNIDKIRQSFTRMGVAAGKEVLPVLVNLTTIWENSFMGMESSIKGLGQVVADTFASILITIRQSIRVIEDSVALLEAVYTKAKQIVTTGNTTSPLARNQLNYNLLQNEMEYAEFVADLLYGPNRGKKKKTNGPDDQSLKNSVNNFTGMSDFGKEATDLKSGMNDFFKDYIKNATNAAKQVKDVLGNSFKSIENSMVEFFTTGKAGFKELANTIIKDLLRIQIQRNILAPLAGALGSSSLFSSLSSAFFADGGVMTSSGPLPLRKYASGGVANSPQMAIYGEGSTPEAYVPLPDGRRIPVAMQGGGNTNVNVVVNMDGATTARGDTPSGLDLGNLIAGVVKNTLVNEKRPGGLLAA